MGSVMKCEPVSIIYILKFWKSNIKYLIDYFSMYFIIIEIHYISIYNLKGTHINICG